MAPAGLNFDVSPTTLAIAAIAAFAFYYYTVDTGEDLLGEIIIDPFAKGADLGETGVSAVYRDWIKPISPKSIGGNIKAFGRWLT